jgi:hypothetical protein
VLQQQRRRKEKMKRRVWKAMGSEKHLKPRLTMKMKSPMANASEIYQYQNENRIE